MVRRHMGPSVSAQESKETQAGERAFTIACIPAFNEEKTIASVVVGSQEHVDLVVVCDDGSKDRTASIAEKLGAKVISHERNKGKGEALRSLFLAARELHADILVTLDGDGQHDPQNIPRLVEELQANSLDVVVGSRFQTGDNAIPAYRKFGNRVLNAVSVENVSDTQSGFRAYNHHAIMSILPSEMGMGADSEILMHAAKKGLKIGEVPISVKYGIGKTSTHNPIYHTLDVFFSILKLTSIRHPLLFYGIPGLGLILVGVYLSFHALALFSAQQTVTNITMTYEFLGFGFILFGLLTLFTGIILFTLSTVVRSLAR